MSGPLLVRALGQVDGVEGERLRVHRRGARIAAPLPRGHVGEAVVVAQGLTFGGLALLAEVAAAGLLAGQRVAHHELAELEERSEEHTSELQSLMRISYAVFCLKKKNTTIIHNLYLLYS